MLPPLAYTKSNEHAWSAGTVWLSAPARCSPCCEDIGAVVATTAARKLVFLNGHGGNSALLNVANRELRLQHGLHDVPRPSRACRRTRAAGSTAGELGMGIHGGLHETAMMLHLRPGLVDTSLFARAVPERLAGNRHVRFGGTVSFGWLSDDFGPTGAIGDPTGATAELGRELFDGAVAGLVEAMHEVAAFEFGR